MLTAQECLAVLPARVTMYVWLVVLDLLSITMLVSVAPILVLLAYLVLPHVQHVPSHFHKPPLPTEPASHVQLLTVSPAHPPTHLVVQLANHRIDSSMEHVN